ncbi:hypothetical protein WKW80_34870 [Variovorax humicola]|uniref:Uncharacterized protein n=1 Tax=Variovorax humicola TaxID=1769758 RepID=A0ABU8WAY6_9BURK
MHDNANVDIFPHGKQTMGGSELFPLINAFEDALTDMRANALFPQEHWAKSAENYRERYLATLDALVAAWNQDPCELENLLQLCATCRDHYARGQTEAATRFATDINALLYRAKTKAAFA